MAMPGGGACGKARMPCNTVQSPPPMTVDVEVDVVVVVVVVAAGGGMGASGITPVCG